MITVTEAPRQPAMRTPQRIVLSKSVTALRLPDGAYRLIVGKKQPLPELPGPSVDQPQPKLQRDEAFVRRVLAEAARHVGYREGKKNANMFSEHFGRPPEMWCADFISYIFEQAGVSIDTASVAAMAEWFKTNGELFQKDPQPGDVIFFNNARKGRWNHVGIVERVENGTVYTIEGNTGGKKGGVARRCYKLGAAKIIGYGRVGSGRDDRAAA